MNEMMESAKHLAWIEQVNPKGLTEASLEDMENLYRRDAVEAYSKVVDDEKIRQNLKLYFDTKAQKLSDIIKDPNQKFWLATQKGKVVGMAGYSISRRLIHSVYVSKEVRGHGVGSILMKRLISETADIADGQPRSILVAEVNTRAIDFYKRLGFELSGAHKEWKIGDIAIPELELEIGGGHGSD
ncbi:MAG TPA: GNAT family N-acetyltransferase [Candidatus Saccharimonadales bacterium]